MMQNKDSGDPVCTPRTPGFTQKIPTEGTYLVRKCTHKEGTLLKNKFNLKIQLGNLSLKKIQVRNTTFPIKHASGASGPGAD